MARLRDLASLPEQIVFEGNVPSDVAKNHLLHQRLLAPTWPDVAPPEAFAWLGEAVAIKDPTAAAFRPQSGNNLLIIGQNGDAARGILATAMVGLAAQYPLLSPVAPDMSDPASPSASQTASVRFYLLDGSPDD